MRAAVLPIAVAWGAKPGNCIQGEEMGPVTPSVFSTLFQLSGLAPTRVQDQGAASSAANVQVSGVGAANSASSASPLAAQIAQFLQSAGAAAQDDPVLKALLALLALIVLLQQFTNQNEALESFSAGAGRNLGDSSSESAGYWMASVEAYQSTTLVLSTGSGTAGTECPNAVSPNSGLQIDVLT